MLKHITQTAPHHLVCLQHGNSSLLSSSSISEVDRAQLIQRMRQCCTFACCK